MGHAERHTETEPAEPQDAHRLRVGRNAPCPCGSGTKYKRCCLQGDLAQIRARNMSALPAWLLNSRRKLHQFEKYACNVYGLPQLMGSFSDTRRDPDVPTLDVVNSLLHSALLRIPSINALEGDLKEADFQRLIGRKPRQDEKAFSADVVANVLDKLELDRAHSALEQVIWKAERNKAFREGSYGGLRCVAIDGWEPFSSYHRHCPYCHVRKVQRKRANGEIEEVDQYYHRYVVALLVGPLIDVVLAIEPVRNKLALQEAGMPAETAEGELTAALRLIDLLHDTYGTFIDAFIFDGLYPNGPTLTKLTEHGYGAFIVLRNEGNEPLKEALSLWGNQAPCLQLEDTEKKESIAFWDVDEIETLDTFKGKLRVVRAIVTKDNGKQHTWCFAILGKRVQRVSLRTALRVTRSRWHIENTTFNQWIQYWNLGHVFRHTANALMAVLLLWALAFNLLQLFVYRRLKRPRRPKDPTNTIRHIVEVMAREVATLPAPIPWLDLLDTS